MQLLTGFAKDFFLLMLILTIVSYLAPGERYRKYLQFYIGIFMAVVLFKPVFSWIMAEDRTAVYEGYEDILQKLDEIEYSKDGGDTQHD